MRKYTSKTQKIDMYSSKHNLSKEYVNYILSEDECMLTFDELKIKYDCPSIGKLPEWLTEEDLQLVINKGINDKYSSMYSYWVTREELSSYMQEFIRKRLHLYKSLSHIRVAVKNRMVWLLRSHLGRSSYISVELDKPIKDSEEENSTYMDVVCKQSNTDKQLELVYDILSVKDKNIKQLLVVVGYLLCSINQLESEYYKIINSCDTTIRENLHKLQDILDRNEDIDMSRKSGIKDSLKKKKVTIDNILKALNISHTTFNTMKHQILQYNLI